MDLKLARCMDCGAYTFEDSCPKCHGKSASPHPPRFSPEDRYGKYRRQLKKLASQEGSA